MDAPLISGAVAARVLPRFLVAVGLPTVLLFCAVVAVMQSVRLWQHRWRWLLPAMLLWSLVATVLAGIVVGQRAVGPTLVATLGLLLVWCLAVRAFGPAWSDLLNQQPRNRSQDHQS